MALGIEDTVIDNVGVIITAVLKKFDEERVKAVPAMDHLISIGGVRLVGLLSLDKRQEEDGADEDVEVNSCVMLTSVHSITRRRTPSFHPSIRVLDRRGPLPPQLTEGQDSLVRNAHSLHKRIHIDAD